MPEGAVIGLLPRKTLLLTAAVAKFVTGRRDQNLRAAPEEFQGAHLRPNPALLALPLTRFRVAVRTRPQHRHEHLRRALRAARRVLHRHRLPGVVDEQLLPGPVHLQHHRRVLCLPLPVQLAVLAVPIPVRLRLAVLQPQLQQRQALAPAQLLVHRREVQCLPARVPAPSDRPYSRSCNPSASRSGGNGHPRPATVRAAATGSLPRPNIPHARASALVPHPQHLFNRIHRNPPRRHREILPGKDPLPGLAAATRPTLVIKTRPVFTINRNGVHHRSESLFTMNRNMHRCGKSSPPAEDTASKV